VGRSFIEFLEAYRYIGMDIDNRILDAGRRSLPAELIASKRPVLEVISRESLIRVAAQRPRWIIAKGVLQHVPPGELNEFFESLAYLVHAGSEAFLFARCAKESTTLSSKTWLHTFDRLQEAAERNSMELDRPDKRRKFLKLRALGVALIIIGQISAPILPALSSCRLKGGRQFFLSQRAAPRGSSTRRPANGRAIKVPRLIDKMITCLH
jgi:hypothetical protein